MVMIRKMTVTTQVTPKPENPNRTNRLLINSLTRENNPMPATLVMHSLTTIHPAVSPQMAKADQ